MTKPGKPAVIGDGARWIWRFVDEIFPKAIQIVDLYHAKEKVRDVAKSVYGQETDLTRQWTKAKVRLLKSSDIEALLDALSDNCEKNDVAKQAFATSALIENGCVTRRFGMISCAYRVVWWMAAV